MSRPCRFGFLLWWCGLLAFGAGAGAAMVEALPGLDASTTELVDANGTGVTQYLESSRVFVRVVDADANGDPASVETTTVDLSTTLAADSETLTLTETGLDTSTFEGSIPLGLAAAGTISNGVLESWDLPGPAFDTVAAEHFDSGGSSTDSATTIGSKTRFVDEWGQPAPMYADQFPVYVEVEDHNANDPALRDTVLVDLSSLSGDVETISLSETGLDTGRFRGSLPSHSGPVSSGNGVLDASSGDTLDASHADLLGNSTSGDSAGFDDWAIWIVDAEGRPVDRVVENGVTHVRVYDYWSGWEWYPDVLTVDLDTLIAGDSEPLDLYETEPTSGIFQGSISMTFGPAMWDYVLQTDNAGAPTWAFDTITATQWGLFDTADTIGSEVRLVDQFGIDAPSLPVGGMLGVELWDHNANDPHGVDTTTVDISTLAGDLETVVLAETGADTGRFTGTLPGQPGPPAPGDGVLQAEVGETVQAVHDDVNSATQSTDTARVVGSAIWLLDEDGDPTDRYVESSTAFVRVFDPADNIDPFAVDSSSVDLFTVLAADAETLVLTETGDDTNVFEGQIDLALGAGSPGNGALESDEDPGPPMAFDEIEAVHVDPVGSSRAGADTVGSILTLLDDEGRPTSRYRVGAMVHLEVRDGNRNDPGTVDSVSVDVEAPYGGDLETLSLFETGVDTGVFRGALPTTYDWAYPQDGILQVDTLDWIQATHDDFLGNSSSKARADLHLTWVEFIDASGRPTDLLLESGTARVRVYDAYTNWGSPSLDTVDVNLKSLYAWDDETLTLTETGAETNVYEGSIDMEWGGGWGDGVLQTAYSGPPDFEFDRVTAIYLGETDEVRTIGSLTEFVDGSGTEVSTYALGQMVHVRVEDQNRNFSPWVESVSVEVESLASGDLETLYLVETGGSTGVFVGSLPLQDWGVSPGNGTLEATVGETIEARYDDYNGPTQSSDTATVAGSRTELLDPSGDPTEVYLESTRLYVRVFDRDANGSPSSVDATSVDLSSLLGGDLESLMLTETGPDTATFEGEMDLAFGPGSPGNGVLETDRGPGPGSPFDTVTAEHFDSYSSSTDTATTTGSETRFADSLWADVATYPAGGTVFVEVSDGNADDPSQVDTVVVEISSSGGDVETLTLTETGLSSGLFRGSIAMELSPAPSPDGILQAEPGDALTATHLDLFGPTMSTDQATVTESAIWFVDDDGNPTQVVLESGTLHVRVFDVQDNLSPSALDVSDVSLQALLTGDREDIALEETGLDTGVFEGSIELTAAGGSSWDGYLYTGNSGPPAFEFDTIVGSHYSDSAIVRTLGSRTFFLDSRGQETEVLAQGLTAHLRVHDQNRNDPAVVDTVDVEVRSQLSGDQETVVLTETGPETGIFEGGLPTDTCCVGTPGDGALLVTYGETLEAEHTDFWTATSSMDTVQVVSSVIEIVDASGVPTDTVVEGSRLHLRVQDASYKWDPTSLDSIMIEVRSDLAGDLDLAWAYETGPDSGIFEGHIDMRLGFGSTYNYLLETWEFPGPPLVFDTITVVHADGVGFEVFDQATTVGSRTRFADAHGQEVTSYPLGAFAYPEVEDQNRNQPGLVDSVEVMVSSGLTGDLELVTLVETSPDSGIFRSPLPTQDGGAPGADGILQSGASDVIQAVHGDFVSNSSSSALAVMVALQLEFVDESGQRTDELLEGGTARLRVGHAAANLDPLSRDSVLVDLTSYHAGDSETIVLVETGHDTGIFAGSIAMEVGPGWGDGVLQTSNSGAPDYTFDTVTASYQTVQATAETVGSVVEFTDAWGGLVDSYGMGERLYVQVWDQNANDPVQVDTADVRLENLRSGDVEFLTLAETGQDTGTFVGSIGSSPVAGSSYDGIVEARAADRMQVLHNHLRSLGASEDRAVIFAYAVRLLDANGEPTELFLESSTVYFELVNSFDNANPFAPDSTDVTLQSVVGFDIEYTTATETGPDTNVFRGEIPMALSPSNIDIGEIDTWEIPGPPASFDTVFAIIGIDDFGFDEASTHPSYTFFRDAAGGDVDVYETGDLLWLECWDHNFNDPLLVDTVDVMVSSLLTGDLELVVLTETGLDTGVYRASLPSEANPAAVPDGTLQVLPEDTLTSTHDDALGLSASGDLAATLPRILLDVQRSGPDLILDWSDVWTGGYRLYRSTAPDDPGTVLIDTTSSDFVDAGAALGGGSYYYRVRGLR